MTSSNPITISELTLPEIPATHALVMREFDRFIGPGYSPEGNASFRRLVTPEFIAGLPGRNGFSLVAKDRGSIIGLFSIRDRSFIALFFVDRDYHNRGIGKKLFLSGKARIAENGEPSGKIEVHSSPYAEKIYRALGFMKTGDEKEEFGIRFVPMEYPLRKMDVPR